MVTLPQLFAAGLDRDAVAYRRRVGRLHLLHRGVYAVGHRPPSPLATAMAAVLACGPKAALSHRSAGALWRILPRWYAPTEVTTTTKRGHPGFHILERHRLPLPELNQTIAGHEVDAVYRAHHLVSSSTVASSTPPNEPSSKTETAMATSSPRGFSTLRITDQRLKHHATKEAQRLRDILRSRSLYSR